MENRRWPLFVQITLGIILALAIVTIANIGLTITMINSLSNTVNEFLTPLEGTTKAAEPIKKATKLIYSPLDTQRYTQPLKITPKSTENFDDDYPPEEHPSKWDYIESHSKKCWFHKTTRDKVCIDK